MKESTLDLASRIAATFYASDEAPRHLRYPEHDLLEAVLLSAVRDLLRSPQKNDIAEEKRRFRSVLARRWIYQDEFSPFSYTWTCYHLQIDPIAFRSRIMKAYSAFKATNQSVLSRAIKRIRKPKSCPPSPNPNPKLSLCPKAPSPSLLMT